MDMDWREGLNSIEERLQHLYTSSLLSDITIQIMDDPTSTKMFKVHSSILGMASPVFERMFVNDCFEKVDSYRIPDVGIELFDLFMRFIYKFEITLNSADEAWALFYLGDKYMVPELKQFCLPYILKNVKPGNACISYEMSKIYNMDELAAQCKKVMIKQTQDVLNDPNFLLATEDTVFMILDQTELTIREVDLFTAVLKWIEKTENESTEEAQGNVENTLKNCGIKVTSSVEEKNESNTDGQPMDSMDDIMPELTSDDNLVELSTTTKDKEIVVNYVTLENPPNPLLGNCSTSTNDKSKECDMGTTSNTFKSKEMEVCTSSTSLTDISSVGNGKNPSPLYKRFLSNIYFLDMMPEEFVTHVATIDLLTPDEKLAIITRLVSKSSNAWPKRFKKCKREDKNIVQESDILSLKFDNLSISKQNTWSNFMMKVNSPVLIAGFEIACCEKTEDGGEEGETYLEDMQLWIFDLSTGKGTTTSALSSVSYGSSLRINLPEPFPVFADSGYEIGISTNGELQTRKCHSLDEKIFIEGDVMFSFFSPPLYTPIIEIYFCNV